MPSHPCDVIVSGVFGVSGINKAMRFVKLTIVILMATLVMGASIVAFARSPVVRSGSASVSSPVTVLELFTSQGCSSCPAANKFVRELDGAPELLTLSYSVDYWDYLGWKDTFGKPEFSEHQRTYGKKFGGKVYTPQMVVNGAVHAAKYSRQKVRAYKLDNVPDIYIAANGGGIEVQIMPQGQLQKTWTVTAVRYRPGIQSVSVKRGENSGRTIKLANVVQACKEIGKIGGRESFSTQIKPLQPGEALAILVQDGKGGPILSAANFVPK